VARGHRPVYNTITYIILSPYYIIYIQIKPVS